MPRDLSGSWDSPGQTRRGEEGGDGPQVGRNLGQQSKKGKGSLLAGDEIAIGENSSDWYRDH